MSDYPRGTGPDQWEAEARVRGAKPPGLTHVIDEANKFIEGIKDKADARTSDGNTLFWTAWAVRMAFKAGYELAKREG